MHIISILNYKSKLLIMLPRSCWPAIRKGTVFLSLVLFYFILLVYFFLSPPPPTLRLEYRNVLYTHLTSAHTQIGLRHIMSNQLTCKHSTLLLIVMLVLLSFSHLWWNKLDYSMLRLHHQNCRQMIPHVCWTFFERLNWRSTVHCPEQRIL